MRYFLGVDVGNHKTHALVADESGLAVGFAQAGTASQEVIGYAGQRAVLAEVIQNALRPLGLAVGDLAGAGLGMAGYDWPSQRQEHLQVLAQLGLTCPLELVNDSLLGLYAGSTRGWGVALVAGTGENCWGVDPTGRLGRVTGNGDMAGEFGGGSSIVRCAVAQVAKAWQQRGPATRLTQVFLQKANAPDPLTLFEYLTIGTYQPALDDVKWVFQLAREGDQVAGEIVAWAARELADLAIGVIRQIDLQDEEFEVVLVGSIWKVGELLIAPTRRAIQACAPGAVLLCLPAGPVVGGVVLGMQCAGIDGAALRPRLVETACQITGEASPSE